MDKNKKKTLTLLTLLLGLFLVVGATYAFFQAQRGQGASAYININSDTTDSLTFSVGESINITASTEDFYEGGQDKSGKTTATARLVPNNTTNEAHEKYNVYFIIDANDFIYTTDDKQVEVLLKVKDPSGTPLTSIEGLNYHEELEGFDITKSQGAFKIALDDLIDANDGDAVTETWNFEVILRNLSTNQALNAGRSFSGKVLITTDTEATYIVPEINSINEDSKTYESISVSLIENELHSSEIDKYYFAIEATDEEPESASPMSIAEKLEPTYQASDKNSYTFNGLQENQNYKIYAYAEDVQGIRSGVKTAIIKTDEYTRVQVTDVTVSEKTHNTIKVKATAISGTKDVTEYGFKIENHETYEEWSWQASDEFEFTGLKAGNTYNIQVTARDELNKEATNSFDKMETTTPFTVTVQVTGGTSTPTSTTVAENGTAAFEIAASAGYDITSAKVTSGDGCALSNNNATLTASNVTSDRTCTVVLDLAGPSASEVIISKVGTSGLGTLAKHDTIGAQDNSYRYSGNNPNNFVCFGNGSENYNNGKVTTCPDTNLYRIIGVFNADGEQRVKLIKSEYITNDELGIASDGQPETGSYDSLKRVKEAPSEGFYWNKTAADNTWESSTLYQALNNGYLTFLDTTWTDKIATTMWHVGGHSKYMVTPKEMYDAEIISSPTVSAQIGLMYASDYGFASEQNSWLSTLDNYNNDNNNNRENNWLFNNVREWIISPDAYFSVSAFNVLNTGSVVSGANAVVHIYACGVRPSFYLKSDVKIKVDSANGSLTSPYRIVI